MPHFLDSLLCPQSIAVVGASRRQGSVGNLTLKNLLAGKYPGRLFAVNPGYPDVEGVRCYPALSDLPQQVEHVIFTVRDERIEPALQAAIAHGVKAVTIMSTLVLADDHPPVLKERIKSILQDANVLACGGNGMGFYNFRAGIWACGFDTRSHRRGGNVSYISQSGSGMSGLIDVEERIDFNFAVSSGQELTVSLEDYLDYALEQPDTKVVGLFMETSRKPQAFILALEKANSKRIPIVVIKVGSTELSAKLAQSHSGAMAGSDASYNAVFDRYGVQRVSDIDELATALIMFAQPHPVAAGGLVSLHDSGGERQLAIDLASKLDVPLAKLSAETVSELESILDPGLPAVNPLDAWSTGGDNADKIMRESFTALLLEPDAALGAVMHARAPHSQIYPTYIDYLRTAHNATGKPVFLVAGRQGTGSDPAVISITREGFPVLDGMAPFLIGTKCLFNYRDYQQRPVMSLPGIAKSIVDKWRMHLQDSNRMSVPEAIELLTDFGVSMNQAVLVTNEGALINSVRNMSYPVVLKTARTDIAHKSDVGGVSLNIADEKRLLSEYRSLTARLGPQIMMAPMVNEPGVELILGMTTDEQFGPIIIMGFGGIYAETVHDVVCALPPFDVLTVRHLLDRLSLCKLLSGQRNRPAPDIDAFCDSAARFSLLAVELQEYIQEIDINPIVLLAKGCVGLDTWVVMKERKYAGLDKSQFRSAVN